MNSFDLLLAVIVFVFFAIGFRAGFIKQLLSLLAVAVGLLSGYFFYKQAGILLLVPVATIAATILFHLIAATMRKPIEASKESKPHEYPLLSSCFAGGLLGIVKGAIVVFTVLMCAHFLDTYINEQMKTTSNYVKGSYAYAQFKKIVPVISNKEIKKAYYMGALLNDNYAKSVLQSKLQTTFSSSAAIKAISEDMEITRDIRNRNYQKLLSNPKFIKLLNDKELVEKIAAIDYEDLAKKLRVQ